MRIVFYLIFLGVTERKPRVRQTRIIMLRQRYLEYYKMYLWNIWDVSMWLLSYISHISHQSCKVKYSQHHSLSCKLKPITFCHFRLCSFWDKRPSHHSPSHFGVLPALLEVAAALYLVSEGFPAAWRRATLGHTAVMQPLPPPPRGRTCIVLCPVTRGHQELGCGWCMCHLVGLLWAWSWVWSPLPCSSPMSRTLSIFKLTYTTCTCLPGRCQGKIMSSFLLWDQGIGEKLLD